jgi:phosphopantothenoylcysteine decarboxylase/phosphopantothenate--cysteine ligase
MNSGMYKNAITARNVSNLRKYGFIFVGPEKGELACGSKDIGRMSSPVSIISKVEKILSVNEK